MGQVLANFLSTPLASGVDGDGVEWPYVAFDLDLSVVKASRNLGFPILYGDGSRHSVLQSAGISSPKAVMVMYTGRKRTVEAVQRIRLAFPAYQNCLRMFYYNTDILVLLYLARTHYEAEQWQDFKMTLLRVIHLAPSNYALRFVAGVTLQKFSESTLQKTKRTMEECPVFCTF